MDTRGVRRDAATAARELLEGKVAVAQDLAEHQTTTAATAKRLGDAEEDHRTALSAYAACVERALGLGWTSDELKTLGHEPPPPRRRTTPRATGARPATAPAPAAASPPPPDDDPAVAGASAGPELLQSTQPMPGSSLGHSDTFR